MPESSPGMPESSAGTDGSTVPTQLAILVPTFDPAIDNVEIWASKVELLAATWPATKLTELSTRLILGCKGTAYQKLQLHQKELLVNDPKSIQRLVELVGGTWGQIPLEKKFELVERAIFRGQQKNDESSDSYVSRNDVVWSELLSKDVRLEEIRAYVLLRGSKLASEDKKRVIVESGAEAGGVLDVKKVTAAIRMLGSGFFQELTGNRRDRTLKTYDHHAFNLEEESEAMDGEHTFWTTSEEYLDDNLLETLAAEDDEDALMVLQFEDTIAETVQADSELSAYFSTYQEARKRLSEKTKFRGFWGVSRKGGGDSKGYGKKGKSSKGKGKGGLERRIANSYCRICWKKGHWKNECPMKPGSTSGSSTSSTMSSSIPTSVVTVDDLPEEFINLETIDDTQSSSKQEVSCFVAQGFFMGPMNRHNQGNSYGSKVGNWKTQGIIKGGDRPIRNQFFQRFRHLMSSSSQFRKDPLSESPARFVREARFGEAQDHELETRKHLEKLPSPAISLHECHFASSGTVGVVDLGASQTVIGTQQVRELLQQLPLQVKQQVKRTPCHLVFRFGNHQTLVSRHALVLPLGNETFRIAVVEGKTPFLLSNTFLKGIQAVIDTHEGTLWSKKLNRYLNIEPSAKNLFLMDINQLWDSPQDPEQQSYPSRGIEECHLTEENTKEHSQSPPNVTEVLEINQENQEVSTNVVKESRQKQQQFQKANPVSATLGPKDLDNHRVTLPKSFNSHVQGCPSETCPISSRGLGGSEQGTPEGDPKDDTGRTLGGEHPVRQGEVGSQVSSGIRRSSLDGLVCRLLRRQPQGGSPEVCDLCGKETRGRECDCKGAEQRCIEGSTKSQGQEHAPGKCVGELMDTGPGGGHRGLRGSRGVSGGGHPTTRTDQWPSGAAELCHGREQQFGPSHDPSRDGHAGDAHTFEAVEHQAGAVKPNEMTSPEVRSRSPLMSDNDFVFHAPCDSKQQSYYRSIQKKALQFRQELRQCIQQFSQKGPTRGRWDLIEIMCSDSSELTSQVQQAGGKALRFGLSQGDLRKPGGRQNLFKTLVLHQPRDVWYSPECRPWCLWSGYNLTTSETTMEKILGDRAESLWQISLGIVLLEYQLQKGSHFHMEQPNGSQMWNIHGIEPILKQTSRCSFDLCKVGSLKDPDSQKPIRKRLVVQSTSDVLYRELHGKHCDRNHEHKTIEGSTIVNGQRMPLSKFTEWYPPKFAKQIARIILKGKIRGGIPIGVGETEDHPTKRRRLGSKLSPAAIEASFPDINWQTVMEKVNRETPRVGAKLIQQGEVIDMIQKLCPNHIIQHIVTCRGMDRCVGPNQPTPKGKAPLRRFICIRRRTEEIVVEPDWEPWEHLSLAKIRRKCTPARLGLTIFAQARRSDEVMNTPPSADVPIRSRVHDEEGMPDAKRHCAEQAHGESEKVEYRQTVDLTSQKHGPLFLKLRSEEQAWLLKLHRNMGHPGAQKLVEFCRQLNCPSHILQAIPEIRCSTCLETSRPTIARPSSIHEPLEFGEVISMDGITWTNKQGESFHFYHFLDQSTVYHTALVSPSRTSKDAIQALTLGWLQWAGPPDLLVMDAASEFNSEEFGNFLQGQGIKSRTCAADAHWQNSRVERHGGVLQVMLTKMDQEETIASYDDLRCALAKATSTKNQWSRHRGYPPEVLVFGKRTRNPGSVISDPNVASHSAALSESSEFQQFHKELNRREQARRAFAAVDNDQALRRAIVQRTRPNRGNYQKGDWVMMWRKKGESQGQWTGPFQVIIQESHQVVWITKGTTLYRIAPEHLRPLSAVEELTRGEDMKGVNQGVQLGVVQFRPMNDGHIPTTEEVSPTPQPVHPQNIDNPNQEQNIGGNEGSAGSQPDHEPETVSVPSENPESLTPEISAVPDPADQAHQIPIPESDQDELFVQEEECFNLCEESAWVFSVDITLQDIERWRNEDDPTEMAFLVSAAKKQRSEVRMSQLNEAEKELFRKAKNKEIESWLSTETVAKILRHQIPTENIMRCRWILTWKPVDSSEATATNQHTAKARLVVLGYEDPLVHEIPRDSPTMTKLSRMLILQIAASNGWDIESFDIKTAFLRGTEVSERTLGIEPPEELRERMKMKPNEVLQLLKGAYGRVDAPFLWFTELKQGLESLDFKASPFDPCVFVLTHPQTGNTEGVIGVHVDDGLCCGAEYFQTQLQKLASKFPFGSHRKRNFTFTGLKIDQQKDHTITVSQEQYVKDIQPIKIGRDRRQVAEDAVTESERQSLRALIGSLSYAAINSRPDLGSRIGNLQSSINRAKVSTLCEANKVLHEAKMYADTMLTIHPIPLQDLRFIAFSDASFASERNPDSHQGMMIMSCHAKIGENRTSFVNPIIWHSKKIQKVAVSTLSAEAMALAGSVDMLSWTRLYWGWLMNTKIPWKHADEALLRLPEAFAAIPPIDKEVGIKGPSDEVQELLTKLPPSNSGIITTDCKPLYDLISRTAPPSCQEFRTQLQAKLIKEHLQSGIKIRWVPSGAQIADALTKVMDSTMLRECLKLGKYCLHDESEILKARSDSRSRLQWLRDNAKNAG